MKVVASALVLAAAVQAASPSPQLYFAPSSLSPSSSSSHSPSPPPLTAQQANAALAHLLSVSHHTQLPLSSSKDDKQWHRVLDEQVDPAQPRIVLALECPKWGCADALPTDFAASTNAARYTFPSLPLTSYLSALSLHLHRFADSLGLSPSSSSIEGLNEFVEEGIKAVAGWQGWISEELGDWIGWEEGDKRKKVKAQVEWGTDRTGILGDEQLLDQSAATLLRELDQLTRLADSFSSSSSSSDDSGAQSSGAPQIAVVHLKGLKEIAAKHTSTSPVFLRASSLLSQTLSGLYKSISASTQAQGKENEAKFLLLTLPSPPSPWLRKRQAWLKPFEVAGAKYRRASSSVPANLNQKVKRSVFSPSANAHGRRQSSSADDSDDSEAKRAPIVPSSHTCFPSFSAAQNATASCLARGKPVKGISTKTKDGEECWVCKCGVTRDDEGGSGKVRRWKGEGCEKEDLSSSTALLLFTTLFLLVLCGGSVLLLAAVGGVKLPGTLSSVGGGGEGRAKRD
ncbi:hypothetical protein JCM8547_003310 [Rhodosporidiobolus lusitaniae]